MLFQGVPKKLYGHPALKSLVVEYFFAKENSLASMYLDAFGPLIPLPTLALAITAVSQMLDLTILLSNQ